VIINKNIRKRKGSCDGTRFFLLFIYMNDESVESINSKKLQEKY